MRCFIGSIVFCMAALTACSGGPPDDRDVAPIGDNPAQLHSSIQSATAAGKHPVFARISCAGRTYDFSPYAQIVRTAHALAVRAYSEIFVFPSPQASIEFDGRSLERQTLPEVPAGRAGAELQAGSACDPRVLNAADFADVTDAWNDLRDPWQGSAPLSPWTKGAQLDAAGNPPRTPRP